MIQYRYVLYQMVDKTLLIIAVLEFTLDTVQLENPTIGGL